MGIQGLMHGKHPVTQTTQYLEQGIILRDCVKIMTIHYGDYQNNYESHEGVRKIVELNFSQLQYKNPNVQILVVKDLTPTPFFTFFLDDGEKFYIDVESMNQIEILHRIQNVFVTSKDRFPVRPPINLFHMTRTYEKHSDLS